MLLECQLLIAQAYAEWFVGTHDFLYFVSLLPHEYRYIVAAYYAQMDGHARYA